MIDILPDKNIKEQFEIMVIGMRDPKQHLNSYKLHYASIIICIIMPVAELLCKVQVDQHPHNASFLGVSYNDVVLRNVLIQDIGFDI